MYYLTESNEIVSDEEKEKMNVSNNFKKQSENVFDLIEVGDLIKYVYYDNSVSISNVDESDLKRLTAINSLYGNIRKSVRTRVKYYELKQKMIDHDIEAIYKSLECRMRDKEDAKMKSDSVKKLIEQLS